ncbi:aminotransferase class III-fold pyridoxal phosphate-dependent enzyme [Salinirubellus salinus]|uniref:Aminotransferase class III-fold pyridoxal phosphate-dependent enzyme n=1 Tax=Salinirubellus salinus TaxID=1364945 RepID=A0A9E7U9M8_9EURY|nr:aminotransferase class III-fold pyridoxal phosphate-dependent enzyme [Salinirubellus salinus]UWM53373.1 aminotransferase class III-fold pyridoxal phosphate-dependent enzyme [Salinirubellus salinus]
MDRDTAVPDARTLPGEAAREWTDYHHRFAAPSTYVYEFVWDVTAEATGPFCTDVDGNVLLDFTSHVAASPLGYNHPRLVEALASLGVVTPGKIAGQDFYASLGGDPADPDLPGPSQLMERLVEWTDHYGMDTVFLSNSGAEAVENAIKICYQQGGHRAVTFDGAFHGRTLGALSMNRSKAIHRAGYPEVPGVVSVPYCTCRGACTCGWRTDGPGGNVLADELHPDHGRTAPDEVAFLVLEPIQGEGGYRVPNERFVADVAAIRERHDIRVISDEIQAGLGRTGERWGVDHLDLEPDIVTAAKGLRVGATVSRSDVFPSDTGRISSTWGAGDLSAALEGAVTMDVVEDEGLLANARERGRQLREGLVDANLEAVTDVRGRGLMLGVEFDSPERQERVVANCFERGLLVLGCGRRTVRLLPPLDVTDRETALGLALFTEAAAAA